MKGSCLCGKVRYCLKMEPNAIKETALCHCRPCRKITGGTSSLNLTVPLSAFILDSGNLKMVRTKHVDEGFDFSLWFCEECGSPIYAVPHWTPLADIAVIQVGTLDDIKILGKTPGTELNVKHRVGWIVPIGDAVQKEAYA